VAKDEKEEKKSSKKLYSIISKLPSQAQKSKHASLDVIVR
jgi:hypothetical protein